MQKQKWIGALLACWLLLCLMCGAQAQTAVYGPQTFDTLAAGTTPAGFAIVGTGTFTVSAYRPVSGANAAQISAGTVFAVYTTAPATTALDAFWNQTLSIGSGYYAESQALFCDATATHGYLVTAAIYPPTSTYNLVISRYTTGVANAVQASTAAFPGNQFGGLTRNPADGDKPRVHAQLIANNDGSITIRARLWEVGQTEPASWENTYTDTSPVATTFYVGFAGAFAGSVPAGTYANVDDVTVTTPQATTVPVPTLYADNANLKYIGAHVTTGSGAAAKTQFVGVGTGVQAIVGGTATLSACYDVSAVANFARVQFLVDGTITSYTLDGTGLVALTLPSGQTVHSVRALNMPLEGPSTHTVYSTQADAIKFLGFQADNGATLLPMPVNPNLIACITDSTGVSYNTLDTSGTVTSYDIAHAWAVMLADDYGADLYLQGHSGTGVVGNVSGVMYANGGWPTALTWFGYAWQGQAYSPAVAPFITIIDLGINDNSAGVSAAAFTTGYISLLNKIYAAWPSTICFCINMPTMPYATAITNGIAGSNANGKAYLVDESAQTLGTSDGTHPNRSGQVTEYAALKAFIAGKLALRVIKEQSAAQSLIGRGRRLN